jgi:hypothetical protein
MGRQFFMTTEGNAVRTILGTHVPPDSKRPGPSGERRPRRVAGRLAALATATAGLMAAAVMLAGSAGAITTPPPNDPPPSQPVQWSLVSNVTGQCLDVVSTNRLTTNPCNGSNSQKFQTLYGSGYAQLRNVATQNCVYWFPPPPYNFLGLCAAAGSFTDQWDPVPGASGSTQWRSQYGGTCLGIPLATNDQFWVQDRSCTDSTTVWHFKLS